MPGLRPVTPAAGGKPPRPVPVTQPDEESVQRSQQKPRVPVLEKHLVDQLSTEEQNSLNSKFKELTEADKKVSEPEKEMLDSKEKIGFYRTKMQELATNNERHSEASLFGPDSWGLNPKRTESAHTDNVFPKKSTYAVVDSVPSTPMSSYGTSPHVDNMFQKKSPFAFADSVPSTPISSYGTSLYADNMFQKKSPFGFDDSVPSTPMHNSGNSPQRFSEGSEDNSFDNLSRFDSFNMRDSGLFPLREFSRFDYVSSTRDFDNDNGFFPPQESLARFDSFRSTAGTDYNPVFPPRDSFARFDSMHSTRDSDYGQGFRSFEDTDPFGSNDPFKTSRRDSDSWKAF